MDLIAHEQRLDRLTILPKHIGVNLELKYPTLSERTYLRLTNCVEVNKFVDTILQTVYDSSSATHHRSFMFSSFNPVLCSALNWKQPNCKDFYSLFLISFPLSIITIH